MAFDMPFSLAANHTSFGDTFVLTLLTAHVIPEVEEKHQLLSQELLKK